MPDQRKPDPNRRPTKAERQAEARRKREELQRQMARRKRTRLIGIIALVVAVALIAALIVLNPFAAPTPQEILGQAAAAQKTAGCTGVKTIGPYDGIADPNDPKYDDRTHIGASATFPTPPALSTYPSTPPASGPHDPNPLLGGVYDQPPPIYQTIHSMEHGAAIIWYDPSISGQALDDLKAFYAQKVSSQDVSQDRVIVAPYSYPEQGAAGKLPTGIQMAVVSWHRLEMCAQVSLPVAFDFTSQYAYPTFDGRTYKGDSPEAERGAAI